MTTLLLLGEVGLGIAISRFGAKGLLSIHLLVGVFAAIFICLLHTVTMFHLIGSQKEMKEEARNLPEFAEIMQAIRLLKMRVFPLATITILATIAAAVSGGGAHTRAWPKLVHQILVAGAFVLNAWTFYVEYLGVRANLILMNLIDFRISGKDLQEILDRVRKPEE